MEEYKQFANNILNNINVSPTPFHATGTMVSILLEKGFKQLKESEQWALSESGQYFVTRNDSSLIAFSLADNKALDQGIRLLGAHTDSPCLKVKPLPNITKQNYLQLGVEVYGGVLLSPWFDRDLSLAGRISFVNAKGQVESVLLDCKRALAIIPSLAIHLDREANSNKTINAQNDIAPIIALDSNALTFEDFLRDELARQCPNIKIGDVLDYEMSLYDIQKGSLLGLKEEFVCSARLDNLLSCFVGLDSLLASNGNASSFLVCTDHEEVGSASACGAQGPFLMSVLKRIYDEEVLTRILSRSMMISVDNAHAVHPNFMIKHEPKHLPLINRGPVLKINANQRYASNSETQAVFANCCKKANVNMQRFVTRSDLGCGSTIGPITASTLGVPTVDVGISTLAMHSIRETGGVKDLLDMKLALSQFLNEKKLWAEV